MWCLNTAVSGARRLEQHAQAVVRLCRPEHPHLRVSVARHVADESLLVEGEGAREQKRAVLFVDVDSVLDLSKNGV